MKSASSRSDDGSVLVLTVYHPRRARAAKPGMTPPGHPIKATEDRLNREVAGGSGTAQKAGKRLLIYDL